MYFEYVLFDNLLITFVVVYLYNSFMNYTLKIRQILLISAILSILLIIQSMMKNLMYSALFLMLSFMLLTIFNTSKRVTINEFIKSYIMLISSFVLCFGFVLFLIYLITGSFGFAYNYDFPIGLIFIGLFLYIKILIKYYNKIKKKFEYSSLIYNCELIMNNKIIKFEAFLDSGNMLKYNTRPVLIIDLEVVRQMLTLKEIKTIVVGLSDVERLHKLGLKTISDEGNIYILDTVKVKINGSPPKCEVAVGITSKKFTNANLFRGLLSMEMV